MAEIEFWHSKAKHLNSIQQQLQGERIRKASLRLRRHIVARMDSARCELLLIWQAWRWSQVVKVLELTKSTYWPAFNRLCKEVAAACTEANDNKKYLSTLEPLLVALTSSHELAQLTELFRPVMHTILLIWKHSKHYNTPPRLVVLMREICNDLIDQVRECTTSLCHRSRRTLQPTIAEQH